MKIELTRAEYARLKRIEGAAEQVLAGLEQHIEAAPDNAKPVSHATTELHDAIMSSGK